MKIALQSKSGRRDALEIVVDGEPCQIIHTAVFGKNPRLPDIQAGQGWSEVFEAWEYKRAKGYVIWRLSSQSYHSQQLARLLRERYVSAETIERVLQECQEWGYLDDSAWLASFVARHRQRLSGRALIAKLRSKGLDADALQAVPELCGDANDEIAAVQQLLETRYRSKSLTEPASKKKVIASLLRRGYSYELVREAIRQKTNP